MPLAPVVPSRLMRVSFGQAMAGGVLLPPRGKDRYMFLVLFFILLVLWLLGWAAFHVAGGLIHLLLIFAVISIIVHFFRGRSAV